MFYEWKTASGTVLLSSKNIRSIRPCQQLFTRTSIIRKISQLVSSKKLVKYVLLAFAAVQIYIIAFSSAVQPTSLPAEHELYDLPRSIYANERGIKSYGDNSDFTMLKNERLESYEKHYPNGKTIL